MNDKLKTPKLNLNTPFDEGLSFSEKMAKEIKELKERIAALEKEVKNLKTKK